MHKLNFNFITFFRLIAIALVLSFVFSQFFTKTSQAAIGINRQINFQGKLVNNPLSTNVSNTSYTIVFTLYDDPDAGQGTVLWQETQSVTTVDGIFRVALGSVTPFPANFNFNWDGLYLGIKVNSDSEMTPRIQMAAVPFAFNAEKVAGLTVQDASGNASTSGTLQVANARTVKFNDAFTTANAMTFGSGTTGTITLGSSSNNLTFTTSGDTTLALPTSGTLCTTTSCAISNWWNQLAGALSPLNTTNDFLLGSIATSTALFSYTGIKTGQTIASVSGSLIVMPNNGYGNIGVRIASPVEPLHVNGNVRVGSSDLSDLIISPNVTPTVAVGGSTTATIFKTAGTGAGAFHLGFEIPANDSSDGFFITTDTNVDGTVDTVALRILANARIGLGTTAPASELHVTRAVAAGVTGKALVTFDQIENQDIFTASKSGATRFVIDQNGNVGVGTSLPSTQLHLRGTTGIRLQGTGTNTDTIDILPGTAATFDRLDFMAVNTNRGAAFHLVPNGTSDQTKITLSNQNSQSIFGSVFLEVNGDTTYISPQNVSSPTAPVTILQFGLGTGVTDQWSQILVTGGQFGIGNTSPKATLHVTGGFGNNAALIVDQLNNGNLITASAAGTTKFTVDSSGNLLVAASSRLDTLTAGTLSLGTTTANALVLGNNTVSTLTQNVDTAGNFVFQKEGSAYSCSGSDKLTLNGSGQLVCGSDLQGAGSTNWWNQLAGALSPVSINDDFLVGGTATSTAKFSYTGIQSGQTIASVSGSLIVIPNNGYGNVGINTTTPREKLQVVGNLEVGALAEGDKSYRFRTSGGALDFEGAGASMYYTVWSGADFTGTQQAYLVLNSATHEVSANGDWRIKTGNTAGAGQSLFTVLADSTHNVGIGTSVPASMLHVRRPTTSPATGKSLAIFDQTEQQEILTASASGITRFTIANNGDVVFTGVLSDSDSNLILDDTVDLFSTTTGLRVGTDGDLSDIDDAAITVSDGLTVSGAIGANGGITFDQATDTLGAFTMAGNIIGGSFIITDIGSTGTDFDTSGGLNITTDAAGTALTVDNAANASSIFVAEDNNSSVFTIADGGNITLTGTITDSNSSVDITDDVIVNSLTIDTADITWSGSTPTITINAAETFTISNGTAADNFVYNTSTNALTIGDGTNGLTFDIDTGMTYQGSGRKVKRITLNAEYPGAVLTASGSATTNGSMTSDASPSAALSNWRTYYEWSSSQTTLQDYTVAVRVKLPEDFSAWDLTNALTISYNTELPGNGSNKMDVVIYNADTSLSAQEQATPVVIRTANISASAKTWLNLSIDDSDLIDNGNALDAAGDTAVIYLKMYSKDDNHVQIGDITLSYLSAF